MRSKARPDQAKRPRRISPLLHLAPVAFLALGVISIMLYFWRRFGPRPTRPEVEKSADSRDLKGSPLYFVLISFAYCVIGGALGWSRFTAAVFPVREALLLVVGTHAILFLFLALNLWLEGARRHRWSLCAAGLSIPAVAGMFLLGGPASRWAAGWHARQGAPIIAAVTDYIETHGQPPDGLAEAWREQTQFQYLRLGKTEHHDLYGTSSWALWNPGGLLYLPTEEYPPGERIETWCLLSTKNFPVRATGTDPRD